MSKKSDSETESRTDFSTAADSVDSQENVDKIRDILFGGQMRDYEQRFSHVEDHIKRESARLASDINSRLEQLDNFVKNEFRLLTEKLAAERRERKNDAEDMNEALGETRKTMENRIADVDEVHGSAEQEIRNRIHEQSNEILDTIRSNQSAIENSLMQESRRLGDEKVAREDLAGLFTELAMRLQREFDLPEDG